MTGINKALDVVYALDMSRNLSPNLLEKSKTFVINSLSTYKISTDVVRVSLMKYPGDSPTVIQSLNDGMNYTQLVEIIQQLSSLNGDRNVDDVIKIAINDAFSQNRGARLQTPKLFVWTLSEGQQLLDKTKISSALKRLDNQGIEYIIVYMGERDKQMLYDVVRNPRQVVVIDPNYPNKHIGDVEKEVGKIGGEVTTSFNHVFLSFYYFCLRYYVTPFLKHI